MYYTGKTGSSFAGTGQFYSAPGWTKDHTGDAQGHREKGPAQASSCRGHQETTGGSLDSGALCNLITNLLVTCRNISNVKAPSINLQ